MNVLITGAGGFVGSYLVESQLAQGHRVRALDLNLNQLAHLAEQSGLDCIIGDLRDHLFLPSLVREVDIVYHLASAHLDVNRSDRYYHQVNVEATKNLLVAAHASGVSRFVHCSSNGVLGEIGQLPADESTPCRPTNIYERTKLLGENAALAYCRETGFPVIVARPAWVYGPRCPRTSRLMRTVRKGRFIMFGNGRTLRHPIFVADAIRGLELCVIRGVPGEVYFLAGDQPVTIDELVQTIAEVQGVRSPKWRLPLAIGIAAGSIVQAIYGLFGRRPPISRRTLDFYMKDNAYSISKAQRDLGFAPQVSLRQGLQQVLAAG
jgi:nucleoside-diphosphate-sugar epimerase